VGGTVVAVLVCRLRELQEEPGTVLSTRSVAGGVGDGRSSAAATERVRARPGGGQRRSVRGQPGRGRRPTAPPAAADRRRQSRRDGGGRVDRRRRPAGRTATGTVLLAQPERDDRRPGEGHIRDGQIRGEDRVRDRLRSGAAATAADRRPQHHDR